MDRPEKRARLDETRHVGGSCPSYAQPTRSKTVWYQDGSIVLETESVRFRVHYSILAQNSPIFQDMMNFAEPHGEEYVDNCPVVMLQDSANDLESLLRALYEQSYFDPSHSQPFSLISAVYRLARKYGMEYLQSRALCYLTDQYPKTIEAWDERKFRVEKYPGLVVDVINLARAHDIPEILPAAFYDCVSTYNVTQIIRGVLPHPRNNYRTVRLAQDDQNIAILGLEQLIKSAAYQTFDWAIPNEPFPTCSDPGECTDVFAKITAEYWTPTPRCVALLPWQSKWEDMLCEDCTLAARPNHEINRRSVWDDLPTYFELKAW
ncbi:hypothetical protein PLICRDRAFT_118702 [Plicaturopsis crispa FD-325 SS-3]|uniref:Unplaced genomic scaffold PLICRscaffold_20, whole genome shotgun sequence n=1 Tax=Plicaturopsis crispa FD-325 SS-3 TaxID=944288 RepID=A0A0C9SKN0_PLICR|nr:hypothetical protein PLICRDRAFT_118702 [Plicaturopsis crispa FD-325 SS-3]